MLYKLSLDSDLLTLLKTSNDVEVQKAVLHEFLYRRTPAAAETVESFLIHTDLELRELAVDTLGHLVSDTSGARLLTMLEDSGQPISIRLAVARALGRLNYIPATDALSIAMLEADVEFKKVVLWALSQVGGKPTLTLIEDLYTIEPEEDMKKQLFLAKRAITKKLWKIGNPYAKKEETTA